jgi:hypothetical protein
MLDGTSPAIGENSRKWRWLLVGFVVALTALRVAYLAFLCPLDLAPDEAHYWDWSRHLDWSYYSKGPLVAWLIRGSCEVFAPMSVSLTGNEMLALRLPAVFFGSLLLVSLYVLTVQVFGSERLAFFVALCGATLPIVSAGSILMTIDSPFICLWGWALVTGHRAVFRNERWAWLLTGLFVGLGILAKYTMGLWLLSLGLFLLLTPTHRPLLFRSGVWLMAGVALLCCLPILIWNASHNWVTFRHVAGQAGVPVEGREQGTRWMGPAAYLGAQFALMLGYWFAAWIGAMIYYRPRRAADPGTSYLWWMSAPTFLVFAAASLRSEGQINWPVAAYISGGVLAAAWLRAALVSTATLYRRLSKVGLGLACGLGLLITAISHESTMARPVLVPVARQIKMDDALAIRFVDPTCRLRGWRFLAGEVDKMRREIAEDEGNEPIIAGTSWNIPGEIGFYCHGHPTVFNLGPYFGDRHNQYDLWRPNPVADIPAFTGKTFVIVSAYEGPLRQAFAHVEPPREVVYHEGDVPVARWRIWICRGYRGIVMETRAGAGTY